MLTNVDSLLYSMCSLAVNILDSPAVDPRSNPDSCKILMRENLRPYRLLHLQLSCAIDKALSSD